MHYPFKFVLCSHPACSDSTPLKLPKVSLSTVFSHIVDVCKCQEELVFILHNFICGWRGDRKGYLVEWRFVIQRTIILEKDLGELNDIEKFLF